MLDPEVLAHVPRAKRDPDVVIHLPGPPRGKGAGRAAILPANPAKGRMAARAMVFQDRETQSYEAMLKYAGELAMRGRPIFDCALRVRMTAVFAIPASFSNKKRAEAIAGIVRHTTRPDDDNLIKTRDGLKGVVWRDDCLIVESVVRKFYGERPGLLIEVWQHTSLLL